MRKLITAATILGVLLGLSAAPAEAAPTVKVLNCQSAVVKPARIYYNSYYNPTTCGHPVLHSMDWKTWGGATARGVSRNDTTVVLFDELDDVYTAAELITPSGAATYWKLGTPTNNPYPA